MFDDDDRRWIDESLREVHVPAELIARLKKVGEDHDALLDGALCAVPVPDRLLAGLKDVPRDARLDTTLRSVPVPEELPERLKSLPGELAVNAELRDVAVPARIADRLKMIPAESPVRPPVQLPTRLASSQLKWLAAAAAILVFAGMTYFVITDRQAVVDVPKPLGEQPSRELVQADRSELSDGNGAVTIGPVEPIEPPDSTPSVLAESPPVEPTFVEPERSLLEMLAEDIEWPDDEQPVRLGMPGRLVPPPPVARVPRLVLRGITPPAVRAYNLLGLARTGIHPFVSPGAHPQLQSVSIPVVTTTGSLKATHVAFRSGQRPNRATVRTEEFLAAVVSPRPSVGDGTVGGDPLRLMTTAGPAPWSGVRRFLVKIDLCAVGDAGRDAPLVAEAARFSITFRPEAVKRYRLLGHEADVAGGLLPGPLWVNLRAGEIATAVFEIELQPIPAGELATVSYSWRDPDGGEFHEQSRGIRRSQLAPTFVEVDPALQLATVAAATAEILRESPHLSERFSASDVIALTDAVHPSLYDDARLNVLLDILEAME